MKLQIRDMAATVAIVVLLLTTSCKRAEESPKLDAGPTPAAIVNNFYGKETTASPSPAIPNLQLEILDSRNKTSSSPLASIDSGITVIRSRVVGKTRTIPMRG